MICKMCHRNQQYPLINKYFRLIPEICGSIIVQENHENFFSNLKPTLSPKTNTSVCNISYVESQIKREIKFLNTDIVQSLEENPMKHNISAVSKTKSENNESKNTKSSKDI